MIKLSPPVTFFLFIIVGENWAEIRKKSSFLGKSSDTDAPILFWIMHPTFTEIPKFELPEVSFTPTRMPAPPQVVNEPKMFVTRPQIGKHNLK